MDNMSKTAAANHDRRAGTCTRCGKNFAECYSASSCDKNLKVAQTRSELRAWWLAYVASLEGPSTTPPDNRS